MGVPKFFRYTSERYPCLNELVKQYQIPDFDNMYLDMNGIIHNCSHPDDSNPHFRITEQKIFEDIFHYISILFQIIKPKKLFFMAIDGVAPRAKMNQQRGRRFRSAREAEELEEKAKAKGETLPSEKRFDSNCITPGTVFMARLHAQLRYFVKNKISTDPLWAKVRVVLSGHETPGEGEHKIMDYIRWARSQPDYDADTRHCLYGLDADLIMLGMCTHEPHFALLREEVKFGKTTQRATSPEETNFYLLHLSLLREYLEQEFIIIKDNLPFQYDLEKIVDDWVLMGFLVGNDFIPNLPNMHISNDAMPLLYKTYVAVLPTLDGYINEAGNLHLGRFEIFMQELAKIDKEAFQETYADLKFFECKTGRRPNANERKQYKPNNDDTFNVNIDEIKDRPSDDLQALINATEDMLFDDINDDDEEGWETETSDDEANFRMEFALHKKDYYMNKLDYSKVTEEVLASQAECYVRAIQWNLHYYYRGCASWCWFYPHHYAPYISDIKGFKDLKIEFELGEPFKPFEQLLAVLPAASKHLLPEPFHDLMTNEVSPIFHYYPINFETDLNGKKNDWEAVVLIPFIDENNLLSAMEPCYLKLTDEERQRNTHGPMLIYNHSSENLGVSNAPEHFPPIQECHATETLVYRNELDVPESKLKRGMLPNAKRDLLFPGFPTMRHLKYKTSLKKNKVKVFDQPSRNENMIVELIREDLPEPNLEDVAEALLGKIIWVGWPHLTKAKVMSVSNEKMRLHYATKAEFMQLSNKVLFNKEMNQGNLHKQWRLERTTIVEHNMNRLGIELGEVTTIIHAVNLKGHKYLMESNTSLTLEPEWCSIPCGYALQAVVKEIKSHMIDSVTRYATPDEAFPAGHSVFLMTGPYYGCLAKIISPENVARSGRIKVHVTQSEEPIPVAAQAPTVQYRVAHQAAAFCGVSPQLLSRVTGCVFVVLGEKQHNVSTEQMPKFNIGLNLKFNKKNMEVSGYTRRCTSTNTWLYSSRCTDLICEYSKEFPELFNALCKTFGNDVFWESELWPGKVGKGKPQGVQEWLKKQPHNSAVKRECGSEALDPEEMVQLAQSIDKQVEELKSQEKRVALQVKINLLYKPELHEGNLKPDPKANYKIYDRVVCASNNITVPLGAKGTITAVYNQAPSNTVRLSDKFNSEPAFQVMFDEPFPGAMKEELFDTPRFYRMLGSNMINISFGRQLRDKVVPATVPFDNYGYNQNQSAVRREEGLMKLRREDGHHSAFASYSPTKDRQTPNSESRPANQSVTPNSNTQTQDPSTELLKSLLKISMPGTDMAEKQSEPLSVDSNWRVRKDQNKKEMEQTSSQRAPPNWRLENNNNIKSHPSSQPIKAQEWTPTVMKNPNRTNQPQNQHPKTQSVPFPSFNPQPGPTQVPFPQFHPQQQQPNNQFHRTMSYQGNFDHQNPVKNSPNAPTFIDLTQHPRFMQQNTMSQPFGFNQGNRTQSTGNMPQNAGNVVQSQGSTPQNVGNMAQNPGNVPQNLGNMPQNAFSQFVQNRPSTDRQNSFPNGAFPKHLPNVGNNALPFYKTGQNNTPQADSANIAPPGNWSFYKTGQKNTPHVDPAVIGTGNVQFIAQPQQAQQPNPFVPLQVVASQRRQQNPKHDRRHSNSQKSDSSIAEAPALQPPTNDQAKNQNVADSSKRQQKKKRSRIAANLPLQLE